jgi:uncharacterized protein (DUF4415 family)
MSVKRMSKPSVASEQPARGRADLSRLRRTSDREIRRTAPAELTDLPRGFWAGAAVVTPSQKQAVSIRVDRDVLAWFKNQGPRYQTRMNAVLRSYVGAMRARSGRSGVA